MSYEFSQEKMTPEQRAKELHYIFLCIVGDYDKSLECAIIASNLYLSNLQYEEIVKAKKCLIRMKR